MRGWCRIWYVFVNISLPSPFSRFLYLSSIDEFGFSQFLRHLPLRWIVWAISDRMPCAYRGYITNKGKCARLLNSPIYTCKGSQDSVNANRIYAGQTENMRRLIFVFPLDTFSCDADHKFWQPNLNLVGNVSPHSTQLTLITSDCAVIKVFNLISLYWRFMLYGQAIYIIIKDWFNR